MDVSLIEEDNSTRSESESAPLVLGIWPFSWLRFIFLVFSFGGVCGLIGSQISNGAKLTTGFLWLVILAVSVFASVLFECQRRRVE